MIDQEPGQGPEMITLRLWTTTQSTYAAQIAGYFAQNYDRWFRNRMAIRSVVIMPRTGTLTMTGAGAEVRNTSDLIIRDGETVTFVELKGSAPAVRQVPIVGWLDEIAFFIPKSIREPFLGDLREDLADMASKGRSRARVSWAAISQVGIVFLRWTWSNLVRR